MKTKKSRHASLPRPIRRLRAIAGCRGRAAALLQRRRRVAVPKIMPGRPQARRAALQPRSMSPSEKTIFRRHPRTGGRAAARCGGDGAAWRYAQGERHHAQFARWQIRLFAAARVFLANYSLQVTECLSALPSRWNCCPSPKPLHEPLQIRITHFLHHSERRKPRATTTTRNDVPSRPRIGGLERVLERTRSL